MKTSRFAQYAAEGSKRMFVGTLIKCTKGEWQMGPDRDLISPNTRFVAVMDTATTGYLKWVGGNQVDGRMGLVADGFQPPHRNELDDLDREKWETDDDGARKDPWQKTDLLVLVSPTAPHDLYTFSTSSVGGASALADLCGAHARTTEGVGQYPVVTLDSDSYLHKIKSRGRIYFPVFKIVDSVEAAPFNAMVAEARGGAGFIPATLPAPERPGMGIEGEPKRVRPIITSGRASLMGIEPTDPTESVEYEGQEDGPPEPTAPPLDHDGGPDYDVLPS